MLPTNTFLATLTVFALIKACSYSTLKGTWGSVTWLMTSSHVARHPHSIKIDRYIWHRKDSVKVFFYNYDIWPLIFVESTGGHCSWVPILEWICTLLGGIYHLSLFVTKLNSKNILDHFRPLWLSIEFVVISERCQNIVSMHMKNRMLLTNCFQV